MASISKLAVVGAALWLDLVAVATAAPADEIIAADRAFSTMAQRDGVTAAFIGFAAPDAMMLATNVGPIKGLAAIRRHLDDGPAGRLEWEPEAAEAARQGDLGYSWGYFRYTSAEPEGKTVTGNYTTIWRRIDGKWKWIVDLGVAAPAKAETR